MTKEEKKDELKNRISMALKDPILQQGFEIICKNLAELENKIADIKANCDLAIEGRDIKIKELEQENNKLLDVINNQDVKIADLEKENAELKKRLAFARAEFQRQYKENAELKSELTKKADTNHYLVEQMADLESENAKLKEQIEDLKDYVIKVSKFLHNNNNIKPNALAYKERDILLIKELKLFEKWELSK